jgi:hypothetical protein
MRRRDKIAELFCAEGADPESIVPQRFQERWIPGSLVALAPRNDEAKAAKSPLDTFPTRKLICPSCQSVAGISN